MADNNSADTGLTDVHRSNHVHSETSVQLIDIPGMDTPGMEQELTQVSRQELALPSRMSTTPHNHSFQPLAPPTGVMSTPPIPREQRHGPAARTEEACHYARFHATQDHLQ